MITNVDLRRILTKSISLDDVTAAAILSPDPKTILPDELAVHALEILRENDISQLLVVNKEGTYLGMLHLHDLVREGIV